jgi:Co/Zn/Cd efflux system component
MQRTLFKIPKMDCPSEERMIRMAIENQKEVRKLEFDISQRQMTLYHEGTPEKFAKLMAPLNFGSEIVSSEAIAEEEGLALGKTDASYAGEAHVLRLLLGINGAMFLFEIVLGWISESAGLVADSLDMFADAAVYGISLYAVGHAVAKQKRAARLSGYFQLILALGAISEVLRRFFYGSDPESFYMMGVAAIALVANAFCMFLIHRHRNDGAHMKASWIFSTNDVIANCGVILAGILVHFTHSNIPDLVIGSIIGVIVLRGAFAILKMSRVDEVVADK